MSVPAGTARAIYYGSNSPGPFAFNFKIYAADHLRVVKTVGNTETVLTLTTDYTVALASDFSSATVTLVSPLSGDGSQANSEQLTLLRDPPISQLTEWPRSDPFPSRTHERAADLAVMLIDRLNEKIGRSILLPESSTVSGLTIPSPDPLKYLRWNAAGDALENMTIADAGALEVSPFVETLLDDTNAAAARTTLGIPTISAFAATVLDDADAAAARTTLGAAPTAVGQGKQTIWVPAGAMTPRATSPAGVATLDSGSSDLTFPVLDFDQTTAEYAQFSIAMPKQWDEGTVTFQPYWTAGSSSGTVAFTLAGVVISDDDPLNATLGTAQTSSDTLIATGDLHTGPESSAITIAGTPAEGDLCVFQISRDVANDTLGADARLIGIKLFFTTNATTDA